MPITHDVNAARAERPLYASLYATLDALAEPHIKVHLQEVTATNGARLLSAQVASLRSFLLEGEEDAEDAAERERFVASLDKAVEHDVASDAPGLSAGDSTQELADQAARSLAGAWLRHLRLTSRDGRVASGALLPAHERTGPDDAWSQIRESVAPHGLDAPSVEAILRGLLEQWLGDGQGDILSPQRLTLARNDVELALGGEAVDPVPIAADAPAQPSILQTIREAIFGPR